MGLIEKIENTQIKSEVPDLRPGTTVVWTNNSRVPHTVTFNNGMADSGVIYPGQSVRFTFTQWGTFAYHCRIHPFMHGWVNVG